MKNNVELKINVSTESALRKISKATEAANKLSIELDKLKNIEIGINVVEKNIRWWQFKRWSKYYEYDNFYTGLLVGIVVNFILSMIIFFTIPVCF